MPVIGPVAVEQVYATPTSTNAWAKLALGVGWRRIKPLTPDGVTNVFVLLCAARANSQMVRVHVDGSDTITRAWM